VLGQLSRPLDDTYLPADTCRMAKKPESLKPASWDICKIATIRLGTVEALDKQAAVEKAAQEFKTEVWRSGGDDASRGL
jgi:hypothetical protein